MEGTVHQGVLRVAVQVGLRQLPHIYIILKRLLHSNAWKHELAVQYSLYSIIDRGDNNLVREKKNAAQTSLMNESVGFWFC